MSPADRPSTMRCENPDCVYKDEPVPELFARQDKEGRLIKVCSVCAQWLRPLDFKVYRR